MSRPTRRSRRERMPEDDSDDLLSGMANLFDLGIVFALGFMVALISALDMLDLFMPDQKVTITKERADGLEVIVKEGQKTTIRRLSKQIGSGEGTRLGTAYRLEDGSVVYVDDAAAVADGS